MAKRAGITLVEVLVAILIMGVGMLSILTLFPIGLLNCKQALRDDRVYQAVTNANSIAIARNIRNDQIVLNAYNGGNFVYVDPFIAIPFGNPPLGSIPRCGVTGSNGQMSINVVPRWFSLVDDYEFQSNATPAPGTSSPLNLVGNYTWAYLLRKQPATSSNPAFPVPTPTDLCVVVYEGRNTAIQGGETPFSVLPSGNQGDTTLTVTWQPGNRPAIGKTGWVLDPTNAQFYRVVSMTDVPNQNASYMELQTPLQNSGVTSILVMEKVVEVLDRGYGPAKK